MHMYMHLYMHVQVYSVCMKCEIVESDTYMRTHMRVSVPLILCLAILDRRAARRWCMYTCTSDHLSPSSSESRSAWSPPSSS